MLNKTLVAALLAGTVGLAGPAFAQGPETTTTTVTTAPGTTTTSKVYALNDGSGAVVHERTVVGPTTTTVERTIVTGPAFRIPDHATGVSRVNGAVGGAIGGYYINGDTPKDNRSLHVEPWEDAYQH